MNWNKKRISVRNSPNQRTNDGWNALTEYADSSSIHGVRYLTAKRPLAERVWWVIAFIISLYCCGTLIINIWNKWEENPVVVSFGETTTPVFKIPFPAVTICPQTKMRTKFLKFNKVFNQYYENMTTEEYERLMSILHICETRIINFVLMNNKNYTHIDCVKYINEMAPKFESVLLNCVWKRDLRFNCNNLFTQILTDIGVCYTFNMINAEELFRETEIHKDYNNFSHSEKSVNWTLDYGYTEEADFNGFPKRVLSPLERDSLELYIGAYDYDMDYICNGPVQGFKIMFHTPSDMPQFKKKYHYILLEQEVHFSLVPKITTTSNSLRNYSPIRRQCFFNKDRYLRFFKVYTQENCELECLTNYTFIKCGCVKFSMPYSNGTPICGADKIQCYVNAEYDLATSLPRQILFNKNNKNKRQTDCNCLPSCTYIDYDTELVQFHLDWTKVIKAFNQKPMDEFNGTKLSHVTIQFESKEFFTAKRTEMYGSTDFIANCGGLLGLFMGVSLLSIVEIIYFCTIRLITNQRMKETRLQSIEDDQYSGIITIGMPNRRNCND